MRHIMRHFALRPSARRSLAKTLPKILTSTMLLAAGMGVGEGAIAQSLPSCQPPAANEYLLLVLNQSPQTPDQLQQTLPANATTVVCNYLGREVTRVSGFSDAQTASSWAQYLSEVGGLQAFVARPVEGGSPAAALPPATAPTGLPPATGTPGFPPATGSAALPPATPSVTAPAPSTLPPATNPTAIAPASPSPSPAPNTTAPDRVGFNPQALGDGYAVLVDYHNQPSIAAEVQQLLARPVGLVSYGQRPYLLAIYTSDAAAASTVLRTLSDRDFSAVVVDSRRTVLLSPAVAVGNP